jgi:hypothetical protein
MRLKQKSGVGRPIRAEIVDAWGRRDGRGIEVEHAPARRCPSERAP